jgi:polar amino acid transport system substrate-binding protein
VKRYAGVFACILVYSVALATTLLPAHESRADALEDVQNRRAIRIAVRQDDFTGTGRQAGHGAYG